MQRSVRRSVILATMCTFLTLGTLASAQARPLTGGTAPYCGIYWGSLAKSVGSRIGDQIPISSVRTGVHTCFDRVVVDLAGPQPLAVASYVYGSTNSLQVTVWGWWGFDVPVGPTPPVNIVPGLTAVRSISARPVGSYGQDVFITTRGRLPFRLFTLAGPGGGSRVVIDIAHRW
jgi:hypothetical protein